MTKTTGLLSLPSEIVPSLKERMDKNIRASGSGCLEWVGSTTEDGYGMTSVRIAGKQRMISAHRASWMIHKGPIPGGSVLDHLCRVRNCVNVDHLEPITLYENTVRGMEARKHLPSTEYRPQFIVPALWKEAKAIAKQRGENLSDIIRAALQAYIDKHQGEK